MALAILSLTDAPDGSFPIGFSDVGGLDAGCRRLALKTFTDKYGDTVSFEPGMKMETDYSGAFFSFTTAIRL